MTGKKGDVKAATSAPRTAGRVAGKWILTYATSRAQRVADFQEFRDDCQSTHESMVGSEVGPVLKTGTLPSHHVCEAPDIVIREDYITVTRPDETKSADMDSSTASTIPDMVESLDERGYLAAMRDYKIKEMLFITETKSSQLFKLDCERKYLPALFVWLLSRLDRGLRTRVESDAKYDALYSAYPRSPCDLLDLIEVILTKGDIRDESFDSFEVIKDLFSPALKMKDQQSLVDFEKLIKDKQRFIQSKDLWTIQSTDPATGAVTTRCVFNEEFFVNLMYSNLSKQYESAMIDYSNQISAGAIKRRTTFDGLTTYFSQVRSNTTGNVVSATTLSTDSTVGKSKVQFKEDGSNNPARVRPCTHCGGAHWDSKCPTHSKSKTNSKKTKKSKAKSAPANNSKSADAPTADEIAKALLHVRAAESKKVNTLAAFQGKAFADISMDDFNNLLSAYADNTT